MNVFDMTTTSEDKSMPNMGQNQVTNDTFSNVVGGDLMARVGLSLCLEHKSGAPNNSFSSVYEHDLFLVQGNSK